MRKLASVLLAFMVIVSCTTDGLVRVAAPKRPAGQEDMVGFAAPTLDTVRIGFVGLGMRGPDAVRRMTYIEGTRTVALCDLRQDRIDYSQQILSGRGCPAAAEYCGDEGWRQLCERDDIDLVYICTDWESHAEIALYAMQHGKHCAIEVPAAVSLEQCWALVNASEQTRKHCMMLENCCYDYFELTALNMAQKGLFGEIVHAEGAYIHNLDIFWDEYWNNWRLEFNRTHRGDWYPTHGLGPVCQALDIHRGDRMTRLVCMDTQSFNGKKTWKKKFGEDVDFANGDFTTTMIATEKGKTILLEHDVLTPRPYNRLYSLTGTEGFASKYPVQGFMVNSQAAPEGVIDIENLNAHSFVPAQTRDRLMQVYKHPLLEYYEQDALEVGGHGGMDYIMDARLIYCLRNGLPLDMDVYDLAEWSCIGALSQISLENGCAPVEFPDFTRGSWNKVQGFSHAFAQ
ncbi:MAG: Gfo/Idh/MocA family protein [Candidatus Cryptobacteroides sp.]